MATNENKLDKILRDRKQRHELESTNSREIKHIPFDKKYNVKKFPNGLIKVIELGYRKDGYYCDDKYIVPNYQRDLVWSLENKQNLIYSIMIGSPIGEFIFGKREIDTKDLYYQEWTVIDGQQRVQAIREFTENKFKDTDGRYFTDYSYREMMYFLEDFDNFSAVSIDNLSEKDQIEIYLSKNKGGVVHTKEELQKAQTILDGLKG